jgi:uncharacterized protein (TIGR03067 family)
MKTRLAVIVAVGLLMGADTKETKKDTDLAQGTWIATELVRNGEKASKEELEKTKLIVTGDKYKYVSSEGEMEGTFKFDPTTKPKSMDVTPAGGQELKAVYSVTAKELKICLSFTGDRPKEFAAKADSGCVLLVLKKE